MFFLEGFFFFFYCNRTLFVYIIIEVVKLFKINRFQKYAKDMVFGVQSIFYSV